MVDPLLVGFLEEAKRKPTRDPHFGEKTLCVLHCTNIKRATHPKVRCLSNGCGSKRGRPPTPNPQCRRQTTASVDISCGKEKTVVQQASGLSDFGLAKSSSDCGLTSSATPPNWTKAILDIVKIGGPNKCWIPFGF